jgi:Ca2+-binding EF-hand superfamily protein
MGKQNIENKKMKKEMQIENRKKSALMKELSNQLEGHHVSLEDVHRIAAEWLEIADKDGNGQLDFEEFEDFFSRLEGVYVSDQVIREIFNQYDTSGDGFLSLDEFCSAIYKAVLNEMRAYGDEEDESCQ